MSNDPVSAKVSGGTLSGAAVGILTAILTTEVPAWHSGLPTPIAALLPPLLGAAGFFVGGYLSKHAATASEVSRAVEDAEKIVAALQLPASTASTHGQAGKP